MKHSLGTLLLLLVRPGLHEARSHPIVGVIDMLRALEQKVGQERKTEEAAFAEFDRWCRASVDDLQKAVAAGEEQKDVLESKVEAKLREEATLTNLIEKLGSEITEQELAATRAQGVRSDAANLWSTADAEFAQTITAINQAIAALQASSTGASSLLQEQLLAGLAQFPSVASHLRTLPRQQFQLAQVLDVSGGRNSSGNGSSEVTRETYTFKSASVIDTLKRLKTDFEDRRVDATKAETAAQNSYDLAKSARDSALAAAATSKTAKEGLRADAQSQRIAANSSLINTKADLEADAASLSDTKQACSLKRSEWEARQKLRTREAKALSAGIDILSKATGLRSEVPVNPAPPTLPVSLLQSSQDPAEHAVSLLRQEANKVQSQSFSDFVERVASRLGGPFDQVNNMIQKMIFRLMAEQRDEDEHKNWCDLELSKTNTSKGDKEAKITSINAKLDIMEADIQLVENDIISSNQMVATLTQHCQEATRIREESKQENEQAVKDARDAQQAIAEAQAVILQFYKDSNMVAKELWEFVQRGGAPVSLPAEPATWNSSYTGVADPTNQPDGIITVLKTISADFASMEATTLAQEETDRKAYEADFQAAEIEKARRAKEAELKAQEKQRLEDKVTALTQSLKHTTGELAAVDKYLADLQPACVEGDSTYDRRKADRDTEIQALKEAQVMLADYQSGNATNSTGSFFAEVRPVNFLSRSR